MGGLCNRVNGKSLLISSIILNIINQLFSVMDPVLTDDHDRKIFYVHIAAGNAAIYGNQESENHAEKEFKH